MTELEKKSRRRFLADLLFMGGGLSAAALLAKSMVLEASDSTPSPTSCPVEAPVPESPQLEGLMEVPTEPIKAGEMVLPEPPVDSPKVVPSPLHVEPTVEGRAKPSRP